MNPLEKKLNDELSILRSRWWEIWMTIDETPDLNRERRIILRRRKEIIKELADIRSGK